MNRKFHVAQNFSNWFTGQVLNGPPARFGLTSNDAGASVILEA